MKESEIIKVFDRYNVIQKGHFIYASGKHGSSYVNKDAIYPHTKAVAELCKKLADKLKDLDAEAVVSPPIGGIILCQQVASFLSKMKGEEILAVYAEKTADKNSFVFTRGYDRLVKNKNVLLVDDVINAGSSVTKLLKTLESIGARPVSIGVLVNSGELDNKLDISIFALLKYKWESWPEKDCPLCKKGIEVNTQLGRGKDSFLV